MTDIQKNRLRVALISAASSLLLFLALDVSRESAMTAQGTLAPSTDTEPTLIPTVVNDLPPLEERSYQSRYSNLDSKIIHLLEQDERIITSARAEMGFVALSENSDRIGVSFYVNGSLDELLTHLRQNGVEPSKVGETFVSAYVPPDVLESASQLPGIWYVRAMTPPVPLEVPLQGRQVNEGVAIHGADDWHAAGYKGQGVKIGIIDGNFGGFLDLMGTELPSEVEVICDVSNDPPLSGVNNCLTGLSPRRNHGTIMTEIVYDIAPEADYYIAESFLWDELRTIVEWMADKGVDIIIVSHSHRWSGPGDGTSPFENSPVNTVNYASEQGILWVNAAGNEAYSMWFGEFQDGDGDGWHEFENGDECNAIEMPAGYGIDASLRWDGAWGEAQDTDLDIYIYRATSWEGGQLGAPLTSSEGNLYGLTLPYESIYARGATIDGGYYCFGIRKASGPAPEWIQFRSVTGHLIERFSSYGTVVSPAEHPNVLAVGAVPVGDLGALWDLSSRGPTTDGRVKPEVVGVHDTTVVSDDYPVQGTSFAGPQVGGLVALVKQAHPHFSAERITAYMKRHAEARGAKPNNDWGWGLAMLPNPDTVETPTPDPTEEPTPEPTPQPTETPTSTPEPTPTTTGTPTPEPTSTPASSPTPEPEEGCLEYLADVSEESDGEREIQGSWADSCESLRPASQSGARYSRYYMFSLGVASDMTISVTSDQDGYLYLLDGFGKDGEVLHENDDRSESPRDTNPLLELESVMAGPYTVDVTTYAPQTMGNFTLSVVIEEVETEVPPTPEPSPEPTPDPPPEATPPPVDIPESVDVQVSSGPYHACVVSEDLFVVCQGHDSNGQVSGHPQTAGWVDVAVGQTHSCALSYDGYVRCWGSNEHGQTASPNVFGYTHLMAGLNFTCAYHQEDRLDCWGKFGP